MSILKRTTLAAAAIGFFAAAGTGLAQQQPPTRAITKIAGDLHRFQNAGHFSVFLVTPAGIVATDPVNADAARWLKAEIARQFNQPVRYLVYSHDHADHISGGEVFADTAIVVAHDNAKREIVSEKRPTAVPNLTFSDRMNIELGGKVVELHYVGRNHSDNSIVVRFPAERVVFAVDFIPVKAMAFRDFPDADFPDWLDSIKRVEAMDFDILAPGHGGLGTKDDARAFRVYLEELRGEVTAQARAGKSLDDMKRTITLEKYKDWGAYKDYLPLNIEGMYRIVQANRRGN